MFLRKAPLASSSSVALLLGLACVLGPLSASAAEPPAKRTEGRFFVEAAEIMLRANDFDAAIADVDADGTGPGGPVADVAELSKWNLQQPKITIGLNRASGKTSIAFTVHDFELSDRRFPLDFKEGGQVVTSPLVPPGIEFQRQRAGGDLIPNWGEEYGFVHRMDYKSLDLAIQRVVRDWERFSLRWIGGLRYAQLEQKTSLRMAFAEEGGLFNSDFQDFFNVQSAVETHGIGPHAGLDARLFAGAKKKWTFRASADVALIPERTAVRYGLSLVDLYYYEVVPGLVIIRAEPPAMPGVPPRPQGSLSGSSFNAFVHQKDFTDVTWLLEGTIGFRYAFNKSVSVGIEGWHLRWMNLLTNAGVIETIHEQATYEVIPANPNNPDPALQDVESVIHVPRFNKRDDVSFDGVSLNLRFEF